MHLHLQRSTSRDLRAKFEMLSAAIGCAFVLSACAGDAINAPSAVSQRSSARPSTAIFDFGDKLGSDVGACVTAIRSEDGRYFGRTTHVTLPERFKNVSATRLSYRGWSPEVAEPTILTICTVPNDAEAIDIVSRKLGGATLSETSLHGFAVRNRVLHSDRWTKGNRPSFFAAPTTMVVIDGLAPAFKQASIDAGAAPSSSSISQVTCEDPVEISPDCIQFPIDDTVYETSPDEADPIEEQPPMAEGSVTCIARADYPHPSTTLGFYGNINAKAHSTCTEPIALISVQTQLWRYRCIWWFCSWYPIAFSLPVALPFSSGVLAPATANCSWSDGWYQTRGFHSFVVIGDSWTPSTRSPSARIRC